LKDVVACQCHAAAHIRNTPIWKLKFDLMTYPLYTYSPSLTPSNCNLFVSLQEALKGFHYTSHQDVKEVVHAWLTAQLKMFVGHEETCAVMDQVQ
jgi:hypothetical protein